MTDAAGWDIVDLDDSVQIVPLRDDVGHELAEDCVCGPLVEFVDPNSGDPFDVPLMTHYALDGRK